MPSISPRRTLLALTLAALVCLPSLALAAPRAHPSTTAREAHAGQGVKFWEGMSIDPDGSHATATPTHVSSDSGMSIDPDGVH